jgi:hypothetical protein
MSILVACSVIAVFLFGAAPAAVAVVAIGVHKDDARPLGNPTPDLAARGARVITGLHVRNSTPGRPAAAGRGE